MISSAKTLIMVRFGRSPGFQVHHEYWPADGEVLEVEKYHPGFDSMTRAGYFTEIAPGTPLLLHEPTGRRFASFISLEQYARDYENPQKRDRSPRRYEPVTPEIAPTPEPEDTSQPELYASRQPKDSRAYWTNWTNMQAMRIFKRAARKVRQEGGKVTQTNLGKWLSPSKHRNTVGKMLGHHRIHIDDL